MSIKYIEANRTVEPHSECILFLYLVDGNHAPVPNVRVKIWAGPPPTGRPAYYEEQEPEQPARRTDPNGKFQFIVAKPTPTQPLDFFVQMIGEDGATLCDPIHYPFPPNEARWVMVTMAPGPAVDQPEASPMTHPEETLIRSGPSNAGLARPGRELFQARAAPPAPSQIAAEAHTEPKQQPRPKLFSHYLLFGPGHQTGTLTSLIIALDYIIRYTPIVGFSVDEAKNAEHVTIVGGDKSVSISAEQSLRDAACSVTRLSASDSYALENVFKQLIDSGSPFPRSE